MQMNPLICAWLKICFVHVKSRDSLNTSSPNRRSQLANQLSEEAAAASQKVSCGGAAAAAAACTHL